MSQNSFSTTKEPAIGTGNRTVILAIMCLLAVITTFMISALNVALPNINAEFRVDAVILNWIIAAYVLIVAIFSVPFGRIADIIGLKKVFLMGIGIFTVSSIGILFANSALILIIIRVLQGIGGAMITSTSTAILTVSFPGMLRGRALGIYTAFVYAGLWIGPLLGGIITEHFSWKLIFLMNIPFGLIAFLMTLLRVKGEWIESKGETFDYTGSFIYGLSLAAIMYGFSLLPEAIGGIITSIGVLGLISFLVYENKVTSPILNVSLFKNNKSFVFSNLAALINYCATAAIAFLISLYLQYIKGFSPSLAGFILISQPLVQTALSPFAGRLSDKVEPRIVASIGMAIICVGLISLALLTNDTAVILIIINLILLGVGFALFSSPNINAIMSSVVPKYYAVASSVTGTMRTLGQTLGMGISMIVMAIVIGREIIIPENYHDFLSSAKIAFVIFAILCLTGVFASLSRGKSQNT
jgi:EmrB/QacA subfamily drug resistance transporter